MSPGALPQAGIMPGRWPSNFVEWIAGADGVTQTSMGYRPRNRMALVDTLEAQLAAFRTTAANLLTALVAELTAAATAQTAAAPGRVLRWAP
jgi:hypothetical protein